MFKKALLLLFISLPFLILAGCELELDSDSKEEPSYEISGFIQLLDGEIELSLNNEEFLTVSGFSTEEFHFENKLRNATSYTVSITRHPESQRCTLYYNEGKVTDQDIDSVRVTCKSFYKRSTGVDEVSVGDSHSCSIKNGSVSCWGSNRSGERKPPRELQNPRLISAGSGQSCVLDDTGVICWGNENSQIITATPPQNLINVRELAAGFGDVCAIDDNGLHCWGAYNVFENYPTDLDNPHSLTVKTSNACVIDGKKPVCWGYNTESITLPDDLLEVEDIDIGQTHGCAITSGLVRCWGSNWGYENGNGPIDIPDDLGPAKIISLGSVNSCVITDTETRCWGSTGFGVDDIQEIGTTPSNLVIDRFHGCAIENDELICFGSNGDGESDFTNALF